LEQAQELVGKGTYDSALAVSREFGFAVIRFHLPARLAARSVQAIAELTVPDGFQYPLAGWLAHLILPCRAVSWLADAMNPLLTGFAAGAHWEFPGLNRDFAKRPGATGA
jgi:hypothetical protein